jgi:poly-gamma-glutamate synthesis protein (capsule biosynthesis protein)
MSCGFAAEQSALLAAVGDVMLARTVPAQIVAHNAAWPWENLAPYTRRADVRFCNLECAVATGGLRIIKKYSFRADPHLAAQVLAAGGINVASLANNHSYDYARTGLGETLVHLRDSHIETPGAGGGRAAAIAPRRVVCGGIKLAFVAYTQWTPTDYLPTEDGAALAILNESTLTAELHAAKQGADFLILSLHWGQEYSPLATAEQQRLAHLAIDAGADLILGSHPHVAQQIEIYRHRPILYSLGNCIFDRSGPHNSNGLLALVRFTPGAVRLEKVYAFDLREARPVRVKSVMFAGKP